MDLEESLTALTLPKDVTTIHYDEAVLSPRIGSLAYTYAHAATSDNTREAYRSDIRQFMAWGGLLPTSVEMLLCYLEEHASLLHPNTLKRRLTAISRWHTYQQLPDPTQHEMIRKVLSGISRTHGRASRKAQALLVEQLKFISDHLLRKNRLIDWRNNALLHIGFFGAFRRSELVAINWEHITFVPKGVEIFIERSKTDQEGEGQICAIPYGNERLCPVSVLKTWQEKSKRVAGPVFVTVSRAGRLGLRALSCEYVSRIIKKLAAECKLPNAEHYSGHSLRRGFATSASEKGADLIAIMRHGRWRSERMVLEYIEQGQQFEENAATVLFAKPELATE